MLGTSAVRRVAVRGHIQRAYPARAWRGLYEGKQVVFGMQRVGRFKKPVKKIWYPNVARNKRLYSEILNRFVRCNVSTHVLRRMDHLGGFDNYFLRTPDSTMKSLFGREMRKTLLDAIGSRQVRRGIARRLQNPRARAPVKVAQ